MIEQIRIMGQDWAVVGDKKTCDHREARGICVHYTQTIFLDPSYPAQAQAVTFVHEFLHALDDAVALGLDHDALQRLSTGIVQVLRDNPEVARHIIKGQRIVAK